VAKVDELMAMCDQLEAQQQERDRCFPVLSRICHARFAEACTSGNLNRIFDETGTVSPDDLRRTILALAVQGSLLPQNTNDKLALNTLLSIAKAAPSSDSVIQDPPYPTPAGWVWLRIGSIFEVAGGIQKTPAREPRSNPYPYLGVGNVYRGRLDLSNIKQFELLPGELERRRLESGDILVIEGNGSFNEIGRCAKWTGEIADCVHQNHVIRCRPCDMRITDFILLFLNSPKGIEIMQRLAITSSGLYSLSVGKIRQIEIPLPPLAEQRRIVAKVHELMALVDHLEAQQQARDKVAEAFAKACVATFTGITQLGISVKMKTSKTELVSVVALGKRPKPNANAPLAKLLSKHKGTLSAKGLWQQSGLTIDVFYQKLKTEIAQGWIARPAEAEMRVLEEG
jgi:type I restriction enzyme S subunit